MCYMQRCRGASPTPRPALYTSTCVGGGGGGGIGDLIGDSFVASFVGGRRPFCSAPQDFVGLAFVGCLLRALSSSGVNI